MLERKRNEKHSKLTEAEQRLWRALPKQREARVSKVNIKQSCGVER